MGQAIQLKTTYKTTKKNNYIHKGIVIPKWNPIFLNASDCFIKVQAANITVNVGLSKYSSLCMGDLRLFDKYDKYKSANISNLVL